MYPCKPLHMMSFLILVGNYEKNLFRKVNRISYTGNMMAPKNPNIGRFLQFYKQAIWLRICYYYILKEETV